MSRKHSVQTAQGVIAEHLPFGIIQASGTTVPSDGAIGYAPGCIFHHVDGTAGVVLYVNDGTAAAAEFNAMSGSNDGVLALSTTQIVVNEDSNDTDIRVESNAVAAFLNLDGSGCLNGQLSVGAAVPTNPQAQVALLPPANLTGVTADQSYYHMTLLPGGATVVPTGTAPIVASLNVAEPNITATGTVTVAATVRIADAPTEGSANYALWVDAGVTRLDGNLDLQDVNIVLGTATGTKIGTAITQKLGFFNATPVVQRRCRPGRPVGNHRRREPDRDRAQPRHHAPQRGAGGAGGAWAHQGRGVSGQPRRAGCDTRSPAWAQRTVPLRERQEIQEVLLTREQHEQEVRHGIERDTAAGRSAGGHCADHPAPGRQHQRWPASGAWRQQARRCSS